MTDYRAADVYTKVEVNSEGYAVATMYVQGIAYREVGRLYVLDMDPNTDPIFESWMGVLQATFSLALTSSAGLPREGVSAPSISDPQSLADGGVS